VNSFVKYGIYIDNAKCENLDEKYNNRNQHVRQYLKYTGLCVCVRACVRAPKKEKYDKVLNALIEIQHSDELKPMNIFGFG
jgi:hypothetical protein